MKPLVRSLAVTLFTLSLAADINSDRLDEILRFIVIAEKRLRALEEKIELKNPQPPTERKESISAKIRKEIALAQEMIDAGNYPEALQLLQKIVRTLETQSPATELKLLQVVCLAMIGVAHCELDSTNPEQTQNSINALLQAEKIVNGLKLRALESREQTTTILLQAGVTYAKAFKAQGNVAHLLRACQCFAQVLFVETGSPVLVARQSEAKQYCEDFGIALEWCQKQQKYTLGEITTLYNKDSKPAARPGRA